MILLHSAFLFYYKLTAIGTIYQANIGNLVSAKVEVIKWHINIKAYNIVTLSFIALITP